MYRAAQAGKRVQALGGAKNHLVVIPDADLDQTVEALMGSAYGSAGERCMAVSVAVAVGDEVADALVDRLAPRVHALRIGSFREPEAEMDPLVTGAHRDCVEGYGDPGVEEGAELVVDGRGVGPSDGGDGTGEGGATAAATATEASSSAAASSTGFARRCRSTPTRSSARCCRSCAQGATRRRPPSSTTTSTAADAMTGWLARRRHEWEAAGLDPGRILFDPGIGFGKDTLQALDLLSALGRFRDEGFRVLVGHSRKVWVRRRRTTRLGTGPGDGRRVPRPRRARGGGAASPRGRPARPGVPLMGSCRGPAEPERPASRHPNRGTSKTADVHTIVQQMLLDRGVFPDPGIREAWDLFEDRDDWEPEPTPPWFPAWILLNEPGLARTLSPREEAGGPKRAFDLVRSLLAVPPGGRRKHGAPPRAGSNSSASAAALPVPAGVRFSPPIAGSTKERA